MFRYQGRLVDGTNLVNATLPMSFKLYNAESDGTLLYVDSSSVLVVDGLYATHIGDDTAFGSLTNALTNATVYLELTIDSETLAPRERLVSVPYALNAGGDTAPAGTIVLSDTYPNLELEAQGYSIVETTSGEIWNFLSKYPEGSYNNNSTRALSFDEKIWIFNHPDATSRISVWNSIEGIQWQCTTTNLGCDVTSGFSVATFNNKMWLLGGYNSEWDHYNDIYCSSDGTNWVLATDTPSWLPRYNSEVITFNEKMWLLGGTIQSNFTTILTDSWWSTNGIAWNLSTSAAPLQNNSKAVEFQNKLWVFNGHYNGGKSWWSANGTNWNSASTNIPLDSYLSSICIANNKIYGLDYSGFHRSDDGVSWRLSGLCYWEDGSSKGLLLSHNKALWLIGNVIARSDSIKKENGLYYYRKD